MKKFLTLLLLSIISLTASAEFRWGPTAGLNISNFYWKQPILKSDYNCGFQAGVMGEVMIPGIGFGIDFAARYNMHGASVNLGDSKVWSVDGYENGNFRLHAIDIPVHLRFKWTRMDGLEQYVAPFAYIGPVFSFNVGQSNCKAIEHPAGSVGLEFALGAEFIEHIQFSVGYQWGVAYDLRTVKLDNLSASTSAWNINVAYLF
ncbi:MAG: PorT family protein [Bacteroides sp.]|nr:PorT family protein [Bacteroides sp.]MDE7461787.1 PorT family protein [Muribaculaceae bacterium]